MEGIAAAHAIRAGHPGTGVVVLSQHADDAYAFELFKNGTAGLAYLLKDRVGDLDELRSAITAVASGGSSIDPLIVEALVASRTRLADSALRWLTPRELDVVREMARGRANPGIATALVLSESAVEKHVSSIFAKLGLGPEPTQDRRVTAVLTFLQFRGTAGLAAPRPPGNSSAIYAAERSSRMTRARQPGGAVDAHIMAGRRAVINGFSRSRRPGQKSAIPDRVLTTWPMMPTAGGVWQSGALCSVSLARPLVKGALAGSGSARALCTARAA